MGVLFNILAIPVGLNDFLDIGGSQTVLILCLFELARCVDEQDILSLASLLEHENDRRNTRAVEDVRGQPDHGIEIILILYDRLSDHALSCSAEQHAMRKHDSHSAAILQMVQAVQNERVISLGLGRQLAVILEPRVLKLCVAVIPMRGIRRICDDGIEGARAIDALLIRSIRPVAF